MWVSSGSVFLSLCSAHAHSPEPQRTQVDIAPCTDLAQVRPSGLVFHLTLRVVVGAEVDRSQGRGA